MVFRRLRAFHAGNYVPVFSGKHPRVQVYPTEGSFGGGVGFA
jgi:hypothetical protein